MEKELKIIKNTIKIGLERPIKFLHMTDSHLTRSENVDVRQKSKFDVDFDGCAEEYFFKAVEYAKRNNMPILYTGDIIDSFSKGNFDFVDEHFSDVDYIYAAGNHDFCHMIGQAKEDYAYKWEKISEIAPHIKNNLYFYSRVIGGVNIVTLDDSYYFITKGQIEMLKAEVAKGYPIILAMHIPIGAKSLLETYFASDEEAAYVVAAPESVLAGYSEARRMQQTPDTETLAALEYIKNEPMIKAVITGHCHLNTEDMLTETLPQFVTHGTFAGYVREFTIE